MPALSVSEKGVFHSGLDTSRRDASKARVYNLLVTDLQSSVGGNKDTNDSSYGIRKLFLM